MVAICLPRGLDLVVAIVAATKAGIGYLPVDPTHPRERINRTLSTAAVRVILTMKDQVADLSRAGAIATTVDDALAAAPTGQYAAASTPSDFACAIFTSGSTGAPKGVVIERRALAAFTRWACAAFALRAGDRFGLAASPGFDASLLEIWPTLAAGACLDVVDTDVLLVPNLLRDWVLTSEVTHLFLTSALAERVLRLTWPSERCAFRRLITGGDRLQQRPRPKQPFRVVNCYGPTEVTIVATSAAVAPPGGVTGLPSIGKALPHVAVYVLDNELRFVPGPAIGELYIGGTGVARGYLGRPDLTAERFVPDPFDPRPAARMYRTGDLGRWLANGEIEFCGRADAQIKIRGNRVEPAEAAAHLAKHPAVAAAHVLPHSTGRAGELSLVAYVVPENPEMALDTGDLKRFAASRLPDYLVPARFVVLPRLPLTTNGKVNQDALPAPESAPAFHSATFSPPRTDIEQWLTEMWQHILSVDHVGIDDSFFDLGGHSLLLAQLHEALGHGLGREVPMDAIMSHHTIRTLADFIADDQRISPPQLDTSSPGP